MFKNLTAFDRHRKTIFYPKTDITFNPAMYTTLKDTHQHDLKSFEHTVNEICLHQWKQIPDGIQPITSGGTYHLVYKVFIKNNTYIIRLNRLPQYHRAWQFLIDEWVYPLLISSGLPAPLIIAVDCSRTHCSTDYEILSFIEGQALTEFSDSQTQYMDLKLVQATGDYVARVHHIKLEKFGPLAVNVQLQGLHQSWRDYIFLRLDEHIGMCLQQGAISVQESEIIKTIFNTHQEIFTISSPALLHGDLGNHNFISVDGKAISALIDWEDCMSGDPVFDIAFWGTFFKDHMLHDFLTGYQKIKALPSDFIQRYWLYYLRIALSKTVHRYRFGYQDHPDRARPSLRIQRALMRLANTR